MLPKILLVSDTADFALTDVYYGYERAMTALGIEHSSFPFHHFRNFHKRSVCLQMLHSEALMKKNGYTHVMFIGDLNIPLGLLESFHGVKTIVVATEDPHSFDPMREKLGSIDLYLTNERAVETWAVAQGLTDVAYCPTAADPLACGYVPRETLDAKYLSDIVFLGALYPNRQKMLEGLIPLVRKKGWDLKVLGHPHYVPRSSPIWDYVPKENFNAEGSIRTIPHEESVKYYNGAKVSLNFMRDTSWSPAECGATNTLNGLGLIAESLNPRAYEVPLCGPVQILEASRAEAREVFTEAEVGFFTDKKTLRSEVSRLLGTPDGLVRMRLLAARKVLGAHTYTHRMQSILARM